jgi:hypothetical protein
MNRDSNSMFHAMVRLLCLAALCAACCVRLPAAETQNAPPAADRETWEVYYLQGKRVGYARTTVKKQIENGATLIVTESISRLAFRRGGDLSKQEMSVSSVETPDGRMKTFVSEMRLGPGAIRATGRVEGGKLLLEVRGPTDVKPATLELDWPAECRGPFAAEQMLREKPMRPGERRQVKSFLPGINQVGVTEMTAHDYENMELPQGKLELLRIDSIVRLPDGQKIESIVWCDRAGETIKTHTLMLDLDSVRVTKAEALAKAGEAELDLLPTMLVKVDKPLEKPHQTSQVRYRLRLESEAPAKVFPTGPTQAVKSLGPHEAEITVYAIRPGQKDGNRDFAEQKSTEDDLKPNGIIQSDDARVVADARRAAGDEKDPWRVAMALERFVNEEIKDKNFSQAFATAAEVARSREGDCTEHAVYLAALARACHIPARVAFGLVYLDGMKMFGYHAWTEVFIDGRWIPIDGTLAQGGIGAAHIKLSDSNLKAASLPAATLPLLRVLGQLRIEIVE